MRHLLPVSRSGERDSSSEALPEVSSIFFSPVKSFFFSKRGRFSSLDLKRGNVIVILGYIHNIDLI